MQCLHPIEVRSKRTRPKVLADGSLSETTFYNLVPCGKCVVCRTNRQKDWIFRLQQENRFAKQSCFCTFTYSDENLPFNGFVPTVRKEDFQKYMKRLRKRFRDKELRFFCASEYGSKTHRPHYHALLFNYSDKDLREIVPLDWKLGFVDIGTVEDASIAYTLKYILKGCFVPAGADQTFTLMSKGIGVAHIRNKDMAAYYRQNPFLTCVGGSRQRLPRYYKDKLGISINAEFESLVDKYSRSDNPELYNVRAKAMEDSFLAKHTLNEIL